MQHVIDELEYLKGHLERSNCSSEDLDLLLKHVDEIQDVIIIRYEELFELQKPPEKRKS